MLSFTERMAAGKAAAANRRYREGTAGGGKLYKWTPQRISERSVFEQIGEEFRLAMQDNRETYIWRSRFRREKGWGDFCNEIEIPF